MAQAGERIGAYEVVRLIARGGMATVYEAHQPALDRAVALKRLDLRTDDPTLVERFIRESRIAASFDHPNIVTVYDFFECEAVPYIAMEYLPRGSLRPFVGRLGQRQAFGVIEGILAGLGHAERRGIVHRDLKPENVLVTTGGAVKIADFGIAKAYTATGNFTASGVAVGTPAYMAPEQALSRGVGPFTDLYAVGVIAYELLGGAPPFGGAESPMAVMYRHVSEAPPPLTGVDPRLAEWVGRMLEKRPEARPGSAAKAWAELEEVVVDICGPYWRRDAALDEGGAAPDAATTTAQPKVATTRRRAAPTPVQPASRPRRRRVPLAGAAVVLALGGAAAVVAFDGDDLAPPGAAPTSTPAPRSARSAAPFDFDGNGDATAAVGITDAGRRGAGVVVLPQLERRMAPSRPRAGLDFGAALASAELNRDRYADLVVGAPGANTGPRSQREGAIYVFAGTRNGLRRANPLVRPWRPDGDAYRSARFGAALAAGDLDGDEYADLAVGTPGSDAAPPDEAGLGSIVLIFGDEKGLSRTRVRTIPRPTGSSGGFGSVLAIADVTGDGRLDLLEGAPGPEGHATFCKGTKRGPEACRVMEGADPGPAAIAAGDVTGDGRADIVHGVPDFDGLTTDTGAVRVWPGGRDGPASEPFEITQESPDIQGSDEPGDRFGASVAVGTIDRDKFADIVVGTPGNNDGTGRVALLFGARDGTDETRDLGYSEATPGPLRALTLGSRFGSSLALLHLTRDRRLDLAVTAAGDRRFVRMSAAGGALDANSATLLYLPGIEAHVGAH